MSNGVKEILDFYNPPSKKGNSLVGSLSIKFYRIKYNNILLYY